MDYLNEHVGGSSLSGCENQHETEISKGQYLKLMSSLQRTGALELENATTNRPFLDLEASAFRFQLIRPEANLMMLVRGGDEGRAGDRLSTCLEGPGPSQPHSGPKLWGCVGSFNNPTTLCQKVIAFFNSLLKTFWRTTDIPVLLSNTQISM